MERYIFYLFSLLLAFFLAGCGSTGLNDDPDDILLRVMNKSNTDFSSVLVSFPEAEGNYGGVSAGQTSEYQKYSMAYNYGYVEVKAGGETYRIQPIDYVGEDPLENGHYTYVLDIVKGELKGNIMQN